MVGKVAGNVCRGANGGRCGGIVGKDGEVEEN